MEERNQRLAITIAIIGVIGTLGAALLQNWDKIVGRPPAVAAPTSPPAPGTQAVPAPAAAVVEPAVTTAAAPATEIPTNDEDAAFGDAAEPGPTSLNGVWRELYPNPGNLTHTTQSGSSFHFTTQGAALGLSFQAYGSGTLHGAQFESSYQTTLPSTGVCKGTLSDGGTRTTSVCFDSVVGRFEGASVRE